MQPREEVVYSKKRNCCEKFKRRCAICINGTANKQQTQLKNPTRGQNANFNVLLFRYLT